jgi:hypothetical protein
VSVGLSLLAKGLVAQLPDSHPAEEGPTRASRSELMEWKGIPSAGLGADGEFLRRIYLDPTGRLPAPDAIRRFVKDDDPAKRDNAIDALMTTPYL